MKRGDIIFFKNSGEPVAAKAVVSDVLQFDSLSPHKVHDILDLYGDDDGIKTSTISHYETLFRQKKYCVLVFIEDVHTVKPFEIDKRGYGALASWITIPSVKRIALG